MSRRRLARIAAAVVGLGLVLAFYSWTAATSADSFPTELSLAGRDYYNHLTDALLQGRAALLVEPPPGLLALQDPYDPAQYGAFAPPHDMSLFDGRYYVYWGPTPAVTLFLPARLLLLGNDLAEEAALVIFSFAGLLVSLALLRYATRRLLPGTPWWMLAFSGLALATGTTALYNLRRPTIYEIALAAGFCFTMAAAYLLLRGALEERHRWRRLALGSACLGLAAGARPTLAVAGVLLLAVLAHLLRSGALPTRRLRVRAVLALLAPVGLAGILLLAYNVVRFESPTQFGLIYQLNEFEPFPPDGGFPGFVPSLYHYLLAPPRIDLNFPFVHLPPPPGYPGTLPAGYNLERVGGIVPMVPVVLLGLAALPVALRSKAPGGRTIGVVMAAGLAAGGLLLLAVSATIYAGTMRYGMDFLPLILVAALLGWMVLARLPQRRLARVFAVGGAIAIAWTAVAGVATSLTGQFESLRFGEPEAYASLEEAASPLAAAGAALAGGPVVTEVAAPQGADLDVRYGQVGAGTLRSLGVGTDPAVLEVISPGRRRASLEAVARRAPGLGAAPARLSVRSRERGEEVVVRSPGGRLDVPVALERGLNHIELRVLEPPPPGTAPGPLVTLGDVELAG